MSKALKAGKKPLYEHPWIQDKPDSSDEEDAGPIDEGIQDEDEDEEEIEDDPQA